MMLGEEQQQALAQALRNQPQYPHYNAAPSAQDILAMGKVVNSQVKNLKDAGKSDAQQYADEFGGYDVDFAAQQAKTPDQGSVWQGLQNKGAAGIEKFKSLAGMFGGAGG